MKGLKTVAQEAFTLLELAAASAVMFMAVVSLAGVIIAVSHQREQIAVKSRVLAGAQNLLEEIKGVAPDVIETGYNGRKYPIQDVTGASSDGTVLAVSVDATDANLLVVTVAGDWVATGNRENLRLQTEIYKPSAH
jgi:type II secretory pathway pseudopilin PulG